MSVQSWFQLIVLLIMENNANVFLLLGMPGNLWLNARHLEFYLVGYWIFSYSHILENCTRIGKLFRNSMNHSVLLLWSVCDVQSNVCVCVCSVVSDSVTPWTVTRQDALWNFPGKDTGVGCHFLLQGNGSSQPRDWAHISCIATHGIFDFHCNTQDL